MKVIAVVFALVAAAIAAPQLVQQRVVGGHDASKDAVILRYDSDNIGVGGYGYNVETSDGQKKEEIAELVNAGTKEEYISVQGRYSYPGEDGNLIEVIYVADKDGFRPQGAHLPVAPTV